MDEDEGTLFSSFQKYEEFSDTMRSLLSLELTVEPAPEDSRVESLKLQKLTSILNEYQDQAYLLDPFLEHLVTPVVEKLKDHARNFVIANNKNYSSERVHRVALLIYEYIKFRGYKSIVRFFPHEVSDLSIALNYMLSIEGPMQEDGQWPLRYAILLWLSLICMLPFDLAQFDEHPESGATAAKLESVAQLYLDKPGLERTGAVLLLSRLFMRKDTQTRMSTFVVWSQETMGSSPPVFLSMAILHVFAEITKFGPINQLESHIPGILDAAASISRDSILLSNTVIRKLRSKLVSRVAMRLLPSKRTSYSRKGRSLTPGDSAIGNMGSTDIELGDNDVDVPDEVENIIEELFEAVQDKDTIVRWSAAKGLARISERLPSDLADQVMETVMGLFSIHAVNDSNPRDLPAIAESTWHGASLTCAEMARRGLVNDSRFSELIKWLSKALSFDVRKGAHSVGSSVRDAACYVFWSLARTQSTYILKPYALSLAQSIVVISLYDREIHIRRAASAAFQENVGRMGLFPHGIDILGKTDFYAVSNRRNAFLLAAPQVAEHDEYQSCLIEHLLAVTLRHWDPSMRQLGAQSLRRICEPNLFIMGPDTAAQAAHLLQSIDTIDIHGGLLALTELAMAYHECGDKVRADVYQRQIFSYLAWVPAATVLSSRNSLIIEAACHLIAASISAAEIELREKSSVQLWRTIIDDGLKHWNVDVQEAAAAAMSSLSKVVDCSLIVNRVPSFTLIQSSKSASASMQQSLARLLGVLDYTAFPHGIDAAITFLLHGVDRSSPTSFSDIETRRNAYLAMPQILTTVSSRLHDYLPPDIVQSIYAALQDGLEDYTVNERGDVGSWVRIACIHGLCTTSEVLFAHAQSIPKFAQYLPERSYQRSVGGILKQGVERLDNVRQQAGEHFMRLLRHPIPDVPGNEGWQIRGHSLFTALFLGENVTSGWQDSSWIFPKATRILDIEEYRRPVLKGLTISIGSKTESIQRPVSSSLALYANGLAVIQSDASYDLDRLTVDLIALAEVHTATNSMMVPILQTFNVLLEADILLKLNDYTEGCKRLDSLLGLITKNLDRIKNVQRIVESMKAVVTMITIPGVRDRSISIVEPLLLHRFPKVRSDTAEFLYLILQAKDIGVQSEETEEILLETEWSSQDVSTLVEPVQRILTSLRS